LPRKRTPCFASVLGFNHTVRMMGIKVNGSTDVFCDNESVVKNSTRPESALKKKHNAISYHSVCEAQTAGIVHIAHEDGNTNLADLLTKCLAAPQLKELISPCVMVMTTNPQRPFQC